MMKIDFWETKYIFILPQPVLANAMVVETAELQSELEAKGELMLAVSEFDEPLEMHLHDTEIEDGVITCGRLSSFKRNSDDTEIEDGVITIQLTDGVLTFDVDEVVAVWHHTHSLADFGLED